MSEKFFMGLDIGYSNLKMVYGTGDNKKSAVLPVGAAPEIFMPKDIRGGALDALYVTVDDERYVAGVEPDRLQSWERELHEGYTQTKSYRALFYAALITADTNVVDTLVTGLPVDQFKDEKNRDQLVELMKGVHQVAPKKTVEVHDVQVVPQPGGAYMHILNDNEDESIFDLIESGRSLVIDPGFFSTDWCALSEGEIRYHSSGTSLEAMSALLEATSDLIGKDYGSAPDIEEIEKAIRKGKATIVHSANIVEFQPYLMKAAKLVAPIALTSMRKSLRKEGMNYDVVILSGGGADLYKEEAKKAFPKAKIILPKNPVMAIADGYWGFGQR